MRNNKSTIFKYFIEFLIVAFGVFLGVYASELQNKKKVRIEKDKSIHYIYEELEQNRKELKKSIEYHEALKIQIDSIAPTLSKKSLLANYFGNKNFIHNKIKGWNGIKIANLEDTAFEAAKISGIIKEFDIGFIKNISRIYKHHETYLKFGNTILTKMVNMNSSTKTVDVLSSIQLMTSDLLDYEKSILKTIEKNRPTK